MNKEQLLELATKETINVSQKEETLEEQYNIIEAAKRFAGQLSSNRYLAIPLTDAPEKLKFRLFEYLEGSGFDLDENWLYGGVFDIDTFKKAMKDAFGIEKIVDFDNYVVKEVLKGENPMETKVVVNGEEVFFGDVAEKFVLRHYEMRMGDEAPLLLMLTVKKALICSVLAQENVEKLEKGELEIFDITPLL